MLHFDSHPDLSLPTNQTNTHDWKDLNKLWDILNQSESGISEFIIPSICSNIISTLTWVKPSWSLQFGVGSHRFTVGNIRHNGTTAAVDKIKHVSSSSCSYNTVSNNDTPLIAAISTNHAYYLGDHFICDDEDMVPTDKIDIIFNVVELTSDYSTFISPSENNYSSSSNTNYNSSSDSNSYSNSDSGPWMLDICLDYFSTYNPFILELQRLLTPYLSAFNLTSITHLLPKPLPSTAFTLSSTIPPTTTPTSTTTATVSTDPSSVCDLPCLSETDSGSTSEDEVMDRLICIIQAVFRLLPTSTRYYTTDNNDSNSHRNNDIYVDTNRDVTNHASKRAKSHGHNDPPLPVPTNKSSNKQHATTYRAALAVIVRLFKHSLLHTDDTSNKDTEDTDDDEYVRDKDKLPEDFLGLYYYSDRPLMAGFLTHVLPYLPSAVKR